MPAILIGLGGGVFCFLGVIMKGKLGYDDSLDVVGVHGVGGTWGAIATGLFASINKASGLFYGNPSQLWIQLASVAATWAFCFIASLVLFKLVDATVGLRATPEEEDRGLDISQHNETGYQA
jgi:Amt family ammonium transporter